MREYDTHAGASYCIITAELSFGYPYSELFINIFLLLFPEQTRESHGDRKPKDVVAKQTPENGRKQRVVQVAGQIRQEEQQQQQGIFSNCICLTFIIACVCSFLQGLPENGKIRNYSKNSN